MTKHVHNPRSKPPSPSPPPPPSLRLSPYGTSNAWTRSRKIITYKSTATNSMLFTGFTRTLRFLFAAPAIVRHCQRSLPTMSIAIDRKTKEDTFSTSTGIICTTSSSIHRPRIHTSFTNILAYVYTLDSLNRSSAVGEQKISGRNGSLNPRFVGETGSLLAPEKYHRRREAAADSLSAEEPVELISSRCRGAFERFVDFSARSIGIVVPSNGFLDVLVDEVEAIRREQNARLVLRVGLFCSSFAASTGCGGTSERKTRCYEVILLRTAAGAGTIRALIQR